MHFATAVEQVVVVVLVLVVVRSVVTTNKQLNLDPMHHTLNISNINQYIKQFR